MLLLEFANGFRSFAYWHISFSFSLSLLGPLLAVSLFFPDCFIVGGGGRAGRVLGGRGGGGAGRTGVGRDEEDWDGPG